MLAQAFLFLDFKGKQCKKKKKKNRILMQKKIFQFIS
jgi:hypothetical protein